MTDALDDVFDAIPAITERHAPGTAIYRVLAAAARREIVPRFGPDGPGAGKLGPFGDVRFPYTRMGAIDSLDLFGLDELILFAFYWSNRSHYRRVVDIGANVGLHSIVLARAGYEVTSYEPDPTHFELLQRNLAANGCRSKTVRAAVSSKAGQAEFVRVLGNTTGSHLAGSKANPYGDLERFSVDVEAFQQATAGADLVKLDVEGHEREILLATARDDWTTKDAMVEIGTSENAKAIFEHFQRERVSLFSQKRGWARVDALADLPTSHREGSVFISMKAQVPWGNL